MTSEEQKRHGKLATALIAGPIVTVGLLGVSIAPVSAETEVDPENSDVIEDEAAGETPGSGGGGEDASGDDDAAGEDDDAGGDDGDSEPGDDDPVSDEDNGPAEDDGGEEDAEDDEADAEDDEAGTEEDADLEDEGAPEDEAAALNDDDEGDDAEEGAEDEEDLQEVEPEAPARYDNTIEIPDVEGVTYEVDGEPVDGGTSVEIGEEESLIITAVPDEGYEFPEDAETFWTESWQPGFEDIWPIDPPEGWEVDEERWYANVPAENLPEGYADWILDYADGANQNAEGSQQFESDTQVYAGPSTEADVLGDLFPTDGAVWWGYLEDEDFWMIVHQYTGAVGFIPGDSHVGDEPPADDDDDEDDDTTPPEDDDTTPPEDDGDDEGDDDDAPISFGSFEVSPTTVEAGGEVTATATGLDAGESVEITLNPTLETVEADENGEFSVTLTIPADTEPGTYELTASSLDREATASVEITVVEPTPQPDGTGVSDSDLKQEGGAAGPQATGDGGLAATGVNGTVMGGIAGFFLALGAGLVAFANRARLFGRKSS